MNELYIAVCDNEQFVLDIIVNTIDSIFKAKGFQTRIFKYDNVKSLSKAMNGYNFSLMLLDIDMPGIDGITFAKKIRSDKNKADIIFVSNREDLVFESLKVHPFGFVRKSAFLNDISNIIDSYIQSIDNNEDVISVSTRIGQMTIKLSNILYIESYLKTQYIYLCDNEDTIQIHSTMDIIENKLKDKGFFRIHKGYIVSFKHILTINKDTVILDNKKELPVSRGNSKIARSKYLDYLQGNNGDII